jgi:hypothetical protein
MTTVRLARLSQFWKDGVADETSRLDQSAEDFVAGLFGQSCSWLFLLLGLPAAIQCWYAADSQAVDELSLTSLLRSNFSEIHIASEEFDERLLGCLTYSSVLTGTPTLKSKTESRPGGETLEKLCRNLFGGKWLYLVAANPIEQIETTRTLNALSEDIKNVRANYLLKSSPIDEENRTAQRYIDLLEAKLKRFERGRISGMWNVRCAFYTDHPPLLAQARHSLQAAFSGDDSLPDPIRVRPCSPQASWNPEIEPLTTMELAALTRPLREDFPGYELTEYARFGVEPNHFPKDSAIMIGEITDRGTKTGNWLCVRRQDLARHGLIVGLTGSGKTNSCFWLLDQIWDNGRGVPFLVVESAKSEYRKLIENPRFRGLRVFTVGDDTVSPLRLNPFEIPSGILVQTHIDYVKSLFSAAFVLYPPMPYVLEQCIQEIYEDRGWDIARNTNSRGIESVRSYPTLADLAAKIPVVVDRMGYEHRIAMDVKAGLLARINQLRLGGGKGLMLAARYTTNTSILFESPCILELKQIVSDDEKAFIMGLLLIRLYEHCELRHSQPPALAHVTLIEEAHRLLRNVSTEQSSDVAANPKGRAIEVFANILSEIRAYGEGILVAEQIPVKLAPDVIKNTGIKIIHRLVARDDREVVGNTVNLDEVQMRYLATLRTGEAVAWTEHTKKASLIQVPLFPTKDAGEVSNDLLRKYAHSADVTQHTTFLPYPACASCSLAESRSCSRRTMGNIDDALIDSFRRVLNAMRLSAPALIPTFIEFHQLIRRDVYPGWKENPYCLFVGLAESEIQRRGESRHWSYADVDWMISSACTMALDAIGTTDQQPALAPSGRMNDILPGFQARCRKLDEIAGLPYPGCRYCISPCQFRFDMAQADISHGKEFRKAFSDLNVKSHRLLKIAESAAARHFFISDRNSIDGAALCFGVQQLAHDELALAMYHQHETAAMLRGRMGARK